MTFEHRSMTSLIPPVFSPALVQLLRDRLALKGHCLDRVGDDVIITLLTTLFFAGLETYEGERYPIGVAFLGRSRVGFIIPEGVASGPAPVYQWKVLRFDRPRPFVAGELMKLAVAGVDRRIYTAVQELEDGSLAITGLARAGPDGDSDPFVRIIATRPGCLSIRSGRALVLGYERGTILAGGEVLVFAAGPVRRALEAAAAAAAVEGVAISDYLDAVRSIVRAMTAHGHGGILVISLDAHPQVAESSTYTMVLDTSLAALLRLVQSLRGAQNPDPPSAAPAFGHLLRNALRNEVERVIEEFGALTGIDGAVLLNRDLALVAFGVILPVDRSTTVMEAADAEGRYSSVVDLGSRGTRHRAGVTYAAQHPGSVVFVASEDGHVLCLLRASRRGHVRLWRLGPSDFTFS